MSHVLLVAEYIVITHLFTAKVGETDVLTLGKAILRLLSVTWVTTSTAYRMRCDDLEDR
jgi:hypothetical protein